MTARFTQVSKLSAAVLEGRTPPQGPEDEALKRSPGWRLYHQWPLRLELAQQVLHRRFETRRKTVVSKLQALGIACMLC